MIDSNRVGAGPDEGPGPCLTCEICGRRDAEGIIVWRQEAPSEYPDLWLCACASGAGCQARMLAQLVGVDEGPF
ncbi:MAG: hypothetical protein ACRD1G_20780 [Acidimicrobiales bacterium]